MKPYSKLACLVLIGWAYGLTACAQTATCVDVADEPHHQLLLQTQDARVFLLDLPRLASTQPHCHAHPFFYVVTGESESSNTVEGNATISRNWRGAEARYVYGPVKHVVRNEAMNPHREVIVETLRQVQYNALDGNVDTDLLAGDWSSLKPTWQISVTRGAVTATKVQLAAGASFSLQSPNHVLIAVSDLRLRNRGDAGSAQTIDLSKEDVRILRGGQNSELTNLGQQAAKFIIVEF